jgi:MAF protein
MTNSKLILASSSPFRRELLSRLHLDITAISPEIDESVVPGESPDQYVTRLSLQKAQAIAQDHPDAIVIGSDQCAYLDGQILGKPGNHENAVQQLRNARGKEVVFYTGLCVYRQSDSFERSLCELFHVGFREVTDDQIENYLITEKPYNCAGSFKSEGYGISLFSYMRGDDPSSLIGLPLIRLTYLLEQAGIEVV